ncbi:MAG: S-layer protein, partial [Candidatus Aenigmarchaeota archaeon]|nr:S-layer protein [Candidatus Aenigmarchaeota archaeon]
HINQKQITKTYTLVPVSGQLLVQANKEGVAITIGSETKAVDAVGTARFTLSPGTYSVKATLKNYADKSASVNIEAGKEASTRFEFIDTDIACTPAWSTGEWGVCINKIKTRTITKSNDCPLNINKPIEAEQCCLEAWTCTEWSACPADASGAKSKRTCTVLTGCEQSQEPQSQTEKDCPAPTQGMLKLSLEPAGAGVFIDGVSKSGTEFTLSAGTYKISASFAGYDDISETATIIAGQTLSKEYILQPFVSKTFDDIKNNKNAEGFAIVIGSTAALSDNIGGSDIAGKLGVSEAAVDLKTDAKNMILVGGPCVNTKVAELAAAGKFPYTCSNWPGEDFVIFKTVKQKGNNYLIVAGTTAEDTRRGGRVVAKLDDYKTALKKKEARFYGKAGNINDVSEVSTVSQQPQEPQQPVCAEGGLRCQGTNLEICSANAWNLKQACANGCDAFTLECKQAVAAEPLQLSGFTWTGVPKKNIPITFTPVASGGTGAYAYSWTITDDDTGVVEAEYSVEKPAHTFLTTDFYIVKLTVTDSLGQAKTISKDINPAPAPA